MKWTILCISSNKTVPSLSVSKFRIFSEQHILTFHHSQERWRVLLRGSVRFLGRYNHSERMHRYTWNLQTKSQTHAQINANKIPTTKKSQTTLEWSRLEVVKQRPVSPADLHCTCPKLHTLCCLLVWPVPCWFIVDNMSMLTMLLFTKSWAA